MGELSIVIYTHHEWSRKREINVRILGITIEEKLKFEMHINNVISKINRVTGIKWEFKDIVPI